jgi:hypothetical protein
MNKLQNITEKVRAKNDPCGNCHGKGSYEGHNCFPCKGKGYVQELEFGCEVLDTGEKFIVTRVDEFYVYLLRDFEYETKHGKDSVINLIKKDDIINLGKPLDGMELLLALSKQDKICLNMDNDGIYLEKWVDYEEDGLEKSKTVEQDITIPLNKKTSEYDEVLLDQLNEIL